jgi:hypothetical protein
MGGDIARWLPLVPSFASIDTLGKGNVHKVITIDTPHYGSPLPFDLLQDSNVCLRDVMGLVGNYALNGVIIGSTTYNGAAADLSVNPNTGDLSLALETIHQPNTHRLPTVVIASVMSPSQLAALNSPTKWLERQLLKFCYSSPLVQSLNGTDWPGVFGFQPSDAIVSLSSQSDGLSLPDFQAVAVHGPGAEQLGFGAPSALDDDSLVPIHVVSLLNTPVSASQFKNTPGTLP